MTKQPVLEDEDYEEGEWVEDNDLGDAAEAMGAVTNLLRTQQQSAIELTRLTLEYCKFENLNKDKIFNIFQDAINLMQKNIKDHIK